MTVPMRVRPPEIVRKASVRISLATTMGLATVTVFALIGALVFFDSAARERSHVLAANRSGATAVADLLANASSDVVEANQAAAAVARLELVSANPNISSATIFRDDAIEPFAQYLAPGATAPRIVRADIADSRELTSDDLIRVSRPVVDARAQPIGSIVLDWSLVAANQRSEQALHRFLIVLTVATLLAVALVWGLGRWQIVRPLRKLVEFAKQLENGVHRPLRVDRGDEIGDLARAFDVMGAAVLQRQRYLSRELELAAEIQTSIVPQAVEVPGLDIAGTMRPATEVGGDYYDVIPCDGRCWFGIGDVAGHGLNAGLVMLMVQSGVATLVRQSPDASPAALLATLNRVIYDNVRRRLHKDEHVTLTLLELRADGTLSFAGAHEDLLVYRAADARCERIATTGTWVGITPDIAATTNVTTVALRPGDVLLLHTDGATEARNASREMFGLARVEAALVATAHRSAKEICEHLLAVVLAWAPLPLDDVSFVAARYLGPA